MPYDLLYFNDDKLPQYYYDKWFKTNVNIYCSALASTLFCIMIFKPEVLNSGSAKDPLQDKEYTGTPSCME